jgi:hypothetical protein
MSLYVVRFMKDVLGDNGREIEACQGTLEVDACNEGQAVELAKQKFCETQALRDWSLRADRFQVKAAHCPS